MTRQALGWLRSLPPYSFAAWTLALSTTGWGLQVANPWFDALALSPSYREMLRLAPESTWGVTIAAAGGLLVLGLWRHSARLIRIGALACFVVRFFQLALIAQASHWQAAGLPDFIAWPTIAAFVFWGWTGRR